MNEKQIRNAILEALKAAFVPLFSDQTIAEDFLSGAKNYYFDELDIDSLGMMEFCISLEVNDVISMTTENVLKLKSLDQLIEVIEASNNDKTI